MIGITADMSNHPNRNWRKRWPEEAGAFVLSSRQRLDVTQKQLAQILGVGERTVQEWEAGDATPPQYLRFAILYLA